MNEKFVLTIEEVAKMCGVSSQTVRRSIKSGKLKAFRFVARGNWYIAYSDLMKFMNEDDQSGRKKET